MSLCSRKRKVHDIFEKKLSFSSPRLYAVVKCTPPEKPNKSHSFFCSSFQKGKKCSKTKKSPEPVRFTYAGCSSVKKYRPKYCGSCVDGRCCTPLQTRTVKMRFRCEDGEMFSKNVMMIQSCKCNYNCPHPNEASFRLYSLFNDIHKFRD